MLYFSASFLWSMSFLSYNYWCSSYSRLTLTFRSSILALDCKCYQDEVLAVMLGCELNCLQIDLSLPLPFLLLFPITFYLYSCPYLYLALCFLHQLYCCCFLVFHEQHWQFTTSKSHDYFFHLLRKKHCPRKMAQAGWLNFSGNLLGENYREVVC